MKSNDLDNGLDVRSAETDRTDEVSRSDAVTLDARSARTPSLSERLRSEYGASGLTRELHLAAGLGSVGLLCFAAGLLVPIGQEVLFALAGIGLFAAVLVYGLSGSRLIEAEDGERAYGTCADNLAAVTAALGAAGELRYVPDSTAGVRLLVPIGADGRFQELGDSSIVDPRGRGLLLEPTGAELHGEFERALTEPVARSPERLAEQLTDALRHRFEFVTAADPVVRTEERQATIAVSGSTFGSVDRFDHPVASFLAVGFAAGLDREVALEVSPATDSGVWLVTCRWDGGEQ